MISIISGTNRPNSKSKEIAIHYQKLLAAKGEAAQVIDLTELPADFTQSALYGNKNAQFEALRDKMNESEKYIFVIPEYNNSFPGVLKAFIDGLSYPNAIAHKKCALVGISDGVQGNAVGLCHIVDIFNYLGMHVLAQRIRIPFMKKNWVDHEIQDAFIVDLIDQQIDVFLKF